MTIKLNGKEHPTAPSTSVESLLQSLSLSDKPVVVELNKKALFPREYADITLNHDDTVEIITIAAGG